MPAGGPPDPWRKMADMYDAFNAAMTTPPMEIQRVLDSWEDTRDHARTIGDTVEEEYPDE